MQKALEHQEHAHHAVEHGGRDAALIVAIIAAMLAVTEQQAKHAEIKVEANAVLAADAWNQYQGKSTRQLVATDLSQLITTLDPPSTPALVESRRDLNARLQDDATRFQSDPKDGKDAIAARAHAFEGLRDENLERAHSFDNAAASFELGIVLATASAITASTLLKRFAILMGLIGLTLAVLGWVDPSLGAF